MTTRFSNASNNKSVLSILVGTTPAFFYVHETIIVIKSLGPIFFLLLDKDIPNSVTIDFGFDFT